jgi:hypothetical protein
MRRRQMMRRKVRRRKGRRRKVRRRKGRRRKVKVRGGKKPTSNVCRLNRSALSIPQHRAFYVFFPHLPSMPG